MISGSRGGRGCPKSINHIGPGRWLLKSTSGTLLNQALDDQQTRPSDPYSVNQAPSAYFKSY